MKRLVGIALLLLVFSGHAIAEDQAVKFNCKQDDNPQSIYFSEIQEFARKLDQSACDAILVPTRKSVIEALPKEDLSAFGGMVKVKVNERFKGVTLGKLSEQLDFFESTLATGKHYPVLNVLKGTAGPSDQNRYYFFTKNQANQGTLTPPDDLQCQTDKTLNARCQTVLEDLKTSINPYQRNANAFTAFETRTKLSLLAKEWDVYFETARAQSFFDIALTTVIEKDHFKKDYLVGPPKRQWFVLHPNIVMEFVDAAPKGDKFTEALTIEWLAVNWWQDSIIGIPFGISLTSLYADRPGVDGVGHGVTLYFDNKYSIGYANHNGKDGIFVSFDLMKLFEDKKQQAERYRDKIKGILN